MMTIQQAFEFALQHHRAGRLAEAEAVYRQILAVRPDDADTWHLLGVIAQQMGRRETAQELIRKAIALNPNNAVAHSNLGEVCRLLGQLDESVAAYRRALAIQPDFPEAYNNLGIALTEQGRLDEAVAAYRQGLQLKPDYAEACNNLANVLRTQGRRDEALAMYRRALELKPDYAEAHSNLGLALAEQGEPNAAIPACRRALELKPDYPTAHVNLGIALGENGQLDEAVAAFRQAIALQPSCWEAHANLGGTIKDQGCVAEAVAAYRKALELNPMVAGMHSNLIYLLHFLPGIDGLAVTEEHQRWNRQFAEPVKRFIPAHANKPDPERRLRIGYVSPEFRDHVTGRYLLPLFQGHDRRSFEIVCYSGAVWTDEMTRTFREHADQWRSTVGLADEALADMIRQDGVDILVDLTQHIAGNRLPMFARQPAPVQVSFAGYPDSAGLEAIEYRLSDRWLESEIGDRRSELGLDLRSPIPDLRTEQVHLLDSFWCYDPCGMEVEVNELPAKGNGHVTFGSLNSFSKVNQPVLRLWARVLRAVPESRLVILSGLGSHRQWTLEFLEREGIAARRVEFVESRGRKSYLELYQRFDIALDTFPYNGHTTSLDALWMGVPVVSLAGKTRVSRGGLSMLGNLGLSELVARSEEEYVNIATPLARDLPRLAELRRTLRARMEASVLMDAPRFARGIEAAYRAMWKRWCEKSEH